MPEPMTTEDLTAHLEALRGDDQALPPIVRKRYRIKVERKFEETYDIWITTRDGEPTDKLPSAVFWERDRAGALPKSRFGHENISERLLKVEEVCPHPKDQVTESGVNGTTKFCQACGERWFD